MGWFERLFGRRKAPAASALAPFHRSDDSEPRFAHYALAHYALRFNALQDPLVFFGVLASEDRDEFIGFLFDKIREDAAEQGAAPDFGPRDLKFHPGRVLDFPAMIIEMPLPRRIAEAYFVGAVLLLDRSRELKPDDVPPVRYFTLEYGLHIETNRPRTVFCEWTEETHKNYGDGPPPTVPKFVERIAQAL